MSNLIQSRRTAMNAVLAAAKNPQPRPIPTPVKNCVHVIPGGVWCDSCAQSYLNYARKLHQKAMQESWRPAVHEAAKKMLAHALSEFTVTDAGLKEAEREYLQSSSTKNSAALFERITQLKKTRTSRNQNARETARKKEAQLNTQEAILSRHTVPNADLAGRMTTQETTLRMTIHAVERMNERNITSTEIDVAFNTPQSVRTDRNQSWLLAAGDIILAGIFYMNGDEKIFLVKTVMKKNEN